MCGYARRHISNKNLAEFLKSIDMMNLYTDRTESDGPEHYYPAFGGAVARQIKGLIIRDDDIVKTVDATWWFECKRMEGRLVVDNTLTTFNARNLTSPYWRGPIRHHRGIVLATALGEGRMVDGKNRQYYMEGDSPLLLGAVYRSFGDGLYSTAIITRDEHPRFSEFHDKAFPLFLPPQPKFLKLWLSDQPETHPELTYLLENPKVFNALTVTPVKTFKDAMPLGESKVLLPD